MNKSRELFLLFPSNGEPVKGFTVIHKNTSPNDEPPYIMVSYWGLGVDNSTLYPEDGESRSHYLIKQEFAARFVNLMNESQKDYCDYYLEGIMTRNCGEHNFKPDHYAKINYQRSPKIKYMHTNIITTT